MNKDKKLKRFDYLLPPVLLVVFPILSFYLANFQELSLKFINKPFYFLVTAVVLATLVLFFLIGERYKASIVVSLFTFIFFSYGHLSRALNSILFIQLPRGVVLGPDKILLPVVFGLTTFLVFKILRSKKSFSKTVSFLTISLLVLVGYLGVAIAGVESKKNNNEVVEKEQSRMVENKDAPDVYYIILDGYARQDVLAEIYNYDNSGFVDSLEKMGFYVANQARSNYIHTYLSLPSTLNMRYLDDLLENYGSNPASGIAARKLVEENQVAKNLKSYGYTTINFVSSWQGTDNNYQADININQEGYFKILGKNLSFDESEMTFLQTTLLSPLVKEVWGDALREKTLSAIQKLPTIPFEEGKKFVTAHILAPHPPYVFNADGSPVLEAELEMADEGIDKRPKYLGQLAFISDQIIPVLQKIIKNSKNPPIIVLQSDHGPASIFGKRENWLENYSKLGVKERSGILYAVYFPDKDYKEFYQTITPVNTFRIIFNKYFKKNLPLLPDKTYYTSYEAIYGFKDVTDIR
jgi:hypothetical protein